MKVLQVVKYYHPEYGGVENYTRQVVLGLKDRADIELEVLTANKLAETQSQVVDGVSVRRVASYGMMFSVPLCPTFPYWLKKSRVDILHFQMPFPLAEFSELLRPKTAKIVVSWHSDIVKQVLQRKIYEPFLLRFLDRTDKILVATPNHITSSIYLPRFRNKCAVVPYGIDIERFAKVAPNDPRVENLRNETNGPIILFVGRLVYYKGLEYLISAMRTVNGNLVIIGNGPLKDQLISLIKKLGLEDKVKILDSVDHHDLPFYYHSCDIFVLPSIANSEAFGLVQVEAMACGKPVISTDLPTGVSFVNQDQVTGLTVPVKDIDSLARAINNLLGNPVKRKEYGENGRKRARTVYNKEQLAENIYKIYLELSRC